MTEQKDDEPQKVYCPYCGVYVVLDEDGKIETHVKPWDNEDCPASGQTYEDAIERLR